MPRAFSRIAFTPSVKEAQTRYGSRQANVGFDLETDPRDTLTDQEARFISERDSFYQATVSETGWPYVQHRGGPAGFLKVLDARTIGYADLKGNAQYVSVGNLSGDDRISLILMDYAGKRRLKLLGRARIVHESDDAALVARLEVPTYRARVERGVLIHIEAVEWNCPQHITPRWSQAQVDDKLAALRGELEGLQAQLRRAEAGTAGSSSWGDGPLPLRITGVRQLSARVRAFELRHANGLALPRAEAGAHLSLPVLLPEGGDTRAKLAWRHYSVMNPAGEGPQLAYEVAVLRDEAGRGGSVFLHRQAQLGAVLHAQAPRNHFPLHTDARPAVLIAGGIGITPLLAMARALKARGRDFALHHAVRRTSDAMLPAEWALEFGDRYHLTHSEQGQRLDLGALLAQAPHDAVFYACGPARLMDAVQHLAQAQGIDPQRVRVERFGRLTPAPTEAGAFELILKRSGQRVSVGAGQTALAALQAAGISAASSCGEGLCGACAVPLLSGVAEHRDQVLREDERGTPGRFCLCVSRARTGPLLIDL